MGDIAIFSRNSCNDECAMSISNKTELNIQMHFENFLNNKINTLMDMNVFDIEINPFFIASTRNQLGINTSRDLAEWLIRQRLERGMVTSFGSTLQSIAKEFCNEEPLPNTTARIARGGKVYNLIIKSGSNHNIPVTQNIQKILLSTKQAEPDSIPIFGVCYGNEETIGSIVKKHMTGVQLLVGRPFWDFISGDPTCYDQILKIATRVDKDYVDPDVGSLRRVMEQKIDALDKTIKKIYSNADNGFWETS